MNGAGEQVVLVDEKGGAVGAALKSEVHHDATPLHLAFSCYVFDASGALLVTRRAESKLTWPGVWTNSVCGHPGPGEAIEQAVHRRARDELGISLNGLRLILPAFRYRAQMVSGTVENELCPVFAAGTTDEVAASASEVAEAYWVPWAQFRSDVLAGRRSVSPWCVEQVRELAQWPDDPAQWGAVDRRSLPQAARPVGG